MEVLEDVYRAGVADGQRMANLELLEQISGPELMCLGRTLRRTIHEALEDAAEAMESLWNDHPAQFARVGTGLGPGLWEVREVSTSPAELTDFSEDEDDGAMTLKLVKPPVTRDLPRPDGSRVTVPVECGPGTTFVKGLWEDPPKVQYSWFALALGLKNTTEGFARWLDNYLAGTAGMSELYANRCPWCRKQVTHLDAFHDTAPCHEKRKIREEQKRRAKMRQ